MLVADICICLYINSMLELLVSLSYGFHTTVTIVWSARDYQKYGCVHHDMIKVLWRVLAVVVFIILSPGCWKFCDRLPSVNDPIVMALIYHRDCNTGIPETGIPGSRPFFQYRNTGIEMV
jgi:hypothetical protein